MIESWNSRNQIGQLEWKTCLGQRGSNKTKARSPKEDKFRESCNPRDKVPIAKIKKSEAFYSSTTEESKEKPYGPNGEDEKKALQDLVWNLERMLNEQNEYITTHKREHNGQTLKRRWTPKGSDAWGGQTADAKNGNTSIGIKMTCRILFGSSLGSFVQVTCFTQRMGFL